MNHLVVNKTTKKAIDRVARGRWVLFTFNRSSDENYQVAGHRTNRKAALDWLRT